MQTNQEDQDLARRNLEEEHWARCQPWLARHGYMLRPRYHPNWVPSWNGTNKDPSSCEDGIIVAQEVAARQMDAVRIADGKMVMIRKISSSRLEAAADEMALLEWFSRSGIDAQGKNRCIPLLDVLEAVGGTLFLVMPFLRPFNNPDFETVGEALHFIQQALEGVHFLHTHYVAHRECTGVSFVMDADTMYPKGFHPLKQDRKFNLRGKAKHHSRSEVRPDYYLANFGRARRMDPSSSKHLIESEIVPTDTSVPELQGVTGHELHDPFATDIYLLGNMIYHEFVLRKRGVEFLLEIVKPMIDDDPARRPPIQDVIQEFSRVYDKLTYRQLRARLMERKEMEIKAWLNDISHFFRKLKYSVKGIEPDLGAPAFVEARKCPDIIAWPDTGTGEPVEGEYIGKERIVSPSFDGHVDRFNKYMVAQNRPFEQISHRWRKPSYKGKQRPSLDEYMRTHRRQNTTSSQGSHQMPAFTSTSSVDRSDTMESMTHSDTQRYNSGRIVYQRRRAYSLDTWSKSGSGPRQTPTTSTNPTSIEPEQTSIRQVESLKKREETAPLHTVASHRAVYDNYQHYPPQPIFSPPHTPAFVESPSESSRLRPLTPSRDRDYDGDLEPETEPKPEVASSIDYMSEPEPEPAPDMEFQYSQIEDHCFALTPPPVPRPMPLLTTSRPRSPTAPSQAALPPPQNRKSILLGKYDCHLCYRRRPNKEKLIEHVTRRHPELFVCNRCASVYTTNNKLLHHQEKRGHW